MGVHMCIYQYQLLWYKYFSSICSAKILLCPTPNAHSFNSKLVTAILKFLYMEEASVNPDYPLPRLRHIFPSLHLVRERASDRQF